jgi:hypothetical protein
MDQEHARRLSQQWDDKDAERDERERRARQLFLEEHANQVFAPAARHIALATADGSGAHCLEYHLASLGLQLAFVMSPASLQRLPTCFHPRPRRGSR